jgi:hypothetical protein
MLSTETEKGHAPEHVVATPIWMLAIRVAQFLVALIIVGLAGALMHDAYLDEEGLALAIGLFTWIIVAYIVVTEKISSLHKAYNVIAVLALDGFLVILWLATWAATAARRAKFVVDVSVSGCSDDGSLISSISCNVIKRSNVLLFKSGAAMLAAIAGLGALVWLLFIASFVWTLLAFLKGRKEGRFAFGSGSDEANYQATPPAEQPMAMQPQQPMQPQTTGGQYPPPAGTYPPQYPPQGQYQPQPPQEAYPQQTQQAQYPQAYPQGPGSSVHSMSPPPQQQTPYSPPQELYTQQEHQPSQQQPQQPYYPQQPQQ